MGGCLLATLGHSWDSNRGTRGPLSHWLSAALTRPGPGLGTPGKRAGLGALDQTKPRTQAVCRSPPHGKHSLRGWASASGILLPHAHTRMPWCAHT